MLQLSLNVCRCMLVCGKGFGVRLGVGCPCPPVRNNIVTPRHLFQVLVISRTLYSRHKQWEHISVFYFLWIGGLLEVENVIRIKINFSISQNDINCFLFPSVKVPKNNSTREFCLIEGALGSMYACLSYISFKRQKYMRPYSFKDQEKGQSRILHICLFLAALCSKTRPDTRLPQSRAVGQGP